MVMAEQPKPASIWPVYVIALPAFVAIWSGWVGLGERTGFGVIHPLPGIADRVTLNTAITLPIGVEAYAAWALHVWLTGRASARAQRFAQWSAIGSLLLGAIGQAGYHLLLSPSPLTLFVSCLPVAILGMASALAYLVRPQIGEPASEPVREPEPVAHWVAHEPEPEPVSEPSGEPISEPIMSPLMSQLVSQPGLVSEPVSEPADEPPSEPSRLTVVSRQASPADRRRWAQRRADRGSTTGLVRAVTEHFGVSPATAKRDVQGLQARARTGDSTR